MSKSSNTILRPLISSSSGNSTFISSGNTKILVDAGTSGKKIEGLLSEINENAENLDGLFVTHEHSDHIQGIGVLSRKYNLPIFATEKVWEYVEKFKKIGKIKDYNKVIIYKEEHVRLNDMSILPFGLSHDAIDTVGYNIFTNNEKISVATDFGLVDENLLMKLSGSSRILIESNHDTDMLVNGCYPDYLKQRIQSNRGHISNRVCGEILSKIDTSSLNEVFLGHLSEENNDPLLALETVKNIFNKSIVNNVDIKLATQVSFVER